ncbi:MAG: ATP-binding protein [Anaerovoracaceae bacterium]|jgi:signal transduction histidine kinase
MSRRKLIIFMAILILLSLIFLLRYMGNNDMYRGKEVTEEKQILSEKESKWIGENPRIPLSVDPKLTYLKESGFLEAYVNALLSHTGSTGDLNSHEEALGEIVVVNNANREELSRQLLTKPLFQIQGRMYVRRDLKEKKEYTAILLKGDFTSSEKRKLTYLGRPMEIQEADTHQDMIEIAERERTDLILGDRNRISSELVASDMESIYKDVGHKVFENNVCIVVPKKHETFYQIINGGIILAPREVYIENGKLTTGENSVITTEENRHSYSIPILIIIFFAVFGGFFIYYLSTKNLYDELTLRMAQLTESKNEMQTTFNGVSSFMAELDSEGRILNMNRFMRESLELTAGDVAGKNISSVMDMEMADAAAVRKAIVQVAAGKDMEACTATVGKKVFDIRIYPIKNQKMEVEKLLFMGADVTEVRFAQRQMLQQNKMIAVGQLAAGVAHEIRNPLSLIRNYCYVLKNIDDEEKRNQAILMIEKAVESSGEIIAALLNFSRVSEGNPEKTSIVSHMESVALINEGLLKKKNIELSIEADRDYKVVVKKESFNMIFINLLSNGVDAIKDKGNILVKVSREKEMLCMDITDTGRGISKEVLGDIFNPFFTTKGSTHGNGLGLYIVYNEVEKMNGSIQVESEIGKGTTFHLKLPILEEDTEWPS